MGTHLKELNEGSAMNTNMTGFQWYSKNFVLCALDEKTLSIRRVKLEINVFMTLKNHMWFKCLLKNIFCSN